jgi:hypothetical protein
MVDANTFLTALYVLVDDLIVALPRVSQPGPASALTTSEVVTLALFGQWARFRGERAFYRYAQRSLRDAFPCLPDRGQFNRQVRRAHAALVAVGQHLAWLLDAPHCPYEALDSLGVVTRNCRRRGRGWLAGQAHKGWCSRLGWFWGFHLLTAVTPAGAITGYGLTPTTVSDQARADTFLAVRHTPQAALPEVGCSASGVYVADTGFEGRAWWPRWATCYRAQVITPPKAHETRARCWPPALRRAHAGLRQIVETVNDRLLTVFGLEHERPHAVDGLRARLAAKVALHNFCLWFNVQLGRPPLACADLIDW